MQNSVSIEPLLSEDWDAVRSIYLQGIRTGDATFEQDALEWKDWEASHVAACRLVARSEQLVVGWAALSPVSNRHVYRGVAEVSVYVEEAARGRGIGALLLTELVSRSEKEGICTLQAGIFPENIASVQLHQRTGFRVVGTRTRLGLLGDRWRDVLLMERRSTIVGV
jgi:L-amino acid N-acyltransferase YncA